MRILHNIYLLINQYKLNMLLIKRARFKKIENKIIFYDLVLYYY